MREIQHFIDGSAFAGNSGRYGDVYNPNTGEVQARVPFATPDEVADTCLFVASQNAAYLSGMNIVVHGGGETPMFLAAAQPVDDE